MILDHIKDGGDAEIEVMQAKLVVNESVPY
jgi:hypothetical protein